MLSPVSPQRARLGAAAALPLLAFLIGTLASAAGAEDALALHRAAQSRDLDAIRDLISAGVDVNRQDEHGRTPLHWLAVADLESEDHVAHRCVAAMALLVEAGADVTMRTKVGGASRGRA